MGKIVIIGVGNSQINALGKMKNAIPDAKCISISDNRYDKPIPNGVELYDYTKNSPTAQGIIKDAMPGSVSGLLHQNIEEIIDEQKDRIRELFD